MAITATFYKDVSKKLNSTKIPTYGYYSEIDLTVELKDVTDLYTPSLIISSDTFMSGGSIINPMHYNYCYLPDFERYYFVRDWSWILGRWECALEVDVLASFKSQIGDSALYVLRSSSSCDPDIVDTKYPVKAQGADTTYQQKTYGSVYNVWNTNIYNSNVTDGFFRVSIVNNDSGAIGAVAHYAISGQVMAELMNKLYSAPTWMNITDANLSQDLQKMMFNPMQYITSVIWIPTGFNTTGQTPIHTIPYGWWSLTLTGNVYQITTGTMSKTVSQSIPVARHPQYSEDKRRWLQLSPYTMAALYFTPFGFVPLDTSKFYNATHIDIEVRIDVITGKGTLILSSHRTVNGLTSYGGTFYTTTAQVGVPITIAQMAVDMSALGQASTWVGAAGIALAAGGLQDSLNNLKNGLVDGVRGIFDNVKQKVTTKPAGNPNTVAGRLKISVAQIQAQAQNGIGGEIQAGLQKGIESIGSGNSLLSSLKEIAGDIGSAALAAAGTCSSSGSSGGMAALSEMLFIQWYFQRIVNPDDNNYGCPLCQNTTLKTLSGFVLCQNGNDLIVSCTPAERQAICAFMEAGFFYE